VSKRRIFLERRPLARLFDHGYLAAVDRDRDGEDQHAAENDLLSENVDTNKRHPDSDDRDDECADQRTPYAADPACIAVPPTTTAAMDGSRSSLASVGEPLASRPARMTPANAAQVDDKTKATTFCRFTFTPEA
jgi:hypothetical protein